MAEKDDFCQVNNTREICKDIGESLKNLRIKNGYSSYENFAIEHDLSRMQYWRIEKGLTNLTIRSLVKILNIHKVSLDDFFRNYHGYKPDNKSGRARGKNHKTNGRSRGSVSARRKKR